MDPTGFAAVLMRISAGSKDREQMMDPQFSGGTFNLGEREDASATTITVQGRDLKAMRFYQHGGQGQGADQEGPSILVDLTPPSGGKAVFLQLIRLNGTEPVPDEAVQHFLAPFHVGPDR